MVIDMNDAQIKTLTQVAQFLTATDGVQIALTGRADERYAQMGAILKRFNYKRLARRAQRSLVLLLPTAHFGLLPGHRQARGRAVCGQQALGARLRRRPEPVSHVLHRGRCGIVGAHRLRTPTYLRYGVPLLGYPGKRRMDGYTPRFAPKEILRALKDGKDTLNNDEWNALVQKI